MYCQYRDTVDRHFGGLPYCDILRPTCDLLSQSNVLLSGNNSAVLPPVSGSLQQLVVCSV